MGNPHRVHYCTAVTHSGCRRDGSSWDASRRKPVADRCCGRRSCLCDAASVEIPQGDTVEVSVIVEPPEQSLAAWVVEVHYNPNVIQVEPGCDAVNVPPGSVGNTSCDTLNRDAVDDLDDTARAFGAVLFTRSEVGFTTPQTLAKFEFIAVGPPGSHSSLEVTTTIFADADGVEYLPTTADGEILVTEPPPTIQGDVDCDGDVDFDDFDFVITFVAGFHDGTGEPDCLNLGDEEDISGLPWGDVNCNLAVNAADALSVLAYQGGLLLGQASEPCFEVGEVMA